MHAVPIRFEKFTRHVSPTQRIILHAFDIRTYVPDEVEVPNSEFIE